MKKLFGILLLTIIIVSCNKAPKGFTEFDQAEVSRENFDPYHFGQAILMYTQELKDHKIIRIASQENLDSLIAIASPASSLFENYNFSDKNIFVFYVDEYSQNQPSLKQSKVYINEEAQEILFDFKLETKGGGSGMMHHYKLYFIEVPTSKSDYSFSGTLETKEKGWQGAGKSSRTFTQ